MDCRLLQEVNQEDALKHYRSKSADVWVKIGKMITPMFNKTKYPHLRDEDVSGRTVRNRTLTVLKQWQSNDYKQRSK